MSLQPPCSQQEAVESSRCCTPTQTRLCHGETGEREKLKAHDIMTTLTKEQNGYGSSPLPPPSFLTTRPALSPRLWLPLNIYNSVSNREIMLFTVVKGEHEIRARVLKKDGKRRGGEGRRDQRPVLFDVSWRVEINFNWIDYKLPTGGAVHCRRQWNTVTVYRTP